MSFIFLLASALGSRLVSRLLCPPRGRASALSPDASRSGQQGALWHSGLHNRKRIIRVPRARALCRLFPRRVGCARAPRGRA